MYKIALLAFGLALLAAQTLADTTACCEGDKDCANIVCQPCNNATRCPECFPNGERVDWREPCCKQLSQVVALTAASVSAATQAYAAAQAASFAATKVVVAASAGASVGSFVSLAQTLSLSINTGKCCEISQDVQANASAYAKSFAASAAEAQAAAAAAASACAAATAASAAAASLYAQAESLIKSSCCGFDLEVYSAVLAAGNYAVQASACVDVATKVATSAQDCARVTSQASSESSGYTTNWAQAKVDNCCNNNFTKSVSANVAGGCLKVIDRARELHGYAEEAFDFVAAYAKEENCIETALKLVDEICASECRDVRVSCCEGGCGGKHKRGADGYGAGEHDKDNDGDSDDTCCLASRSVAEVYLAAKASAEAAAQAAVYSQSVAQVYTETIAVAYTAARAASGAAASIKIDVQSCCSVVVTIDTAAFANAKAVGKSFSQAAAAAKAYSYGFGTAQSVSQAIALGVAAAKSTVQAFYSGCCGKNECKESRYLGAGGRLRCCDYTQNVAQAFSKEYINLVSNACTQSESLSKSESAAATGAKAQDCTNLIRRATTRSAFLLQCCCCNTKNVVASTYGYGAKNTKRIYFDAPKSFGADFGSRRGGSNRRGSNGRGNGRGSNGRGNGRGSNGRGNGRGSNGRGNGHASNGRDRY